MVVACLRIKRSMLLAYSGLFCAVRRELYLSTFKSSISKFVNLSWCSNFASMMLAYVISLFGCDVLFRS